MALYKEQRDENNTLTGYIRTVDNACIPLSPDNRDYQEVLVWLQGNTADADDTLLNKLKQKKVEEYKKEGVRRIQLQVSEWNSIDVVGLIASVWNMLGTPNAAQTAAKGIYVYVKNTAIPAVMAKGTIAEVQAIDVANDPNWP